MSTYRVPTLEECGLNEDGPGLSLYNADGEGVISEWYRPAWCFHLPSWLGGAPVICATRDDALVAWCLATGRRHLSYVPTWDELGGSGTAAGAAGDNDSWSWELDHERLELSGNHQIHVDDEVEARWTVAVLQALDAFAPTSA